MPLYHNTSRLNKTSHARAWMQNPEIRVLPVEEIKKLMRREKNKKMAAFSRTKNMLHVSALEDAVGRVVCCPACTL